MPDYTSISVIYNPYSTGNGKQLALKLKKDLQKQKVKPAVKLIQTKHAGHAEELAHNLAKATKHPLVISASGDGGYNEVINGLMKARAKGASPVAGLLPAGNANDHYNSAHHADIVTAIANNQESRVDLLVMEAKSSGKSLSRYAHSYIGIGLTPAAGKELNKVKLNALREVMIVLKVLFSLRSVKVRSGGKTYHYDSLIFSNTKQMSKVLSLSKNAKLNDGLFEVTAFRRRNKLSLIRALMKASTLGLSGKNQTKKYAFSTPHKTLVQCDGEIMELNENSKVTISIVAHALPCIV